MKLAKIITLAAAITSTAAVSSTYQTVVTIDDLAKTLNWIETTQMKFPTILLDANAVSGATCHTSTSSNTYNQLCLTDRTGATNAYFDVSGSPYASVQVNLDETAKVQEGISFVAYNSDKRLTLNTSGQGTYSVLGQLKLQDRAAVVSDSLTFTYDLEFTAQ